MFNEMLIFYKCLIARMLISNFKNFQKIHYFQIKKCVNLIIIIIIE